MDGLVQDGLQFKFIIDLPVKSLKKVFEGKSLKNDLLKDTWDGQTLKEVLTKDRICLIMPSMLLKNFQNKLLPFVGHSLEWCFVAFF